MSANDSPEFDFRGEFESVKDVPCRVHHVTIEGNRRTQPHVILRELEGVRDASTLDELKDELLIASQNLASLNIFRNVDILVDAGPDDVEGSADLVVTVEEKGFYRLEGGTYLQGNEGSVEAKVRIQNVMGTAEVMEASASMGSKSSAVYSFLYHQPRVAGTGADGDWRVFQNTRCLQHHSSHTEMNRGTSVGLTHGNHQLGYELSWRRLTDPSGLASKAVRQQLGDGVKSAVSYAWEVDVRDNPYRPSSGAMFRTSTEVAGIGFDPAFTRFVKQVLQAQVALPVVDGVSITLDAKAGVMLPWGAGGGGPSSIGDRFNMGGPSSLRGFHTRGVGPSDVQRPPRDHADVMGAPKVDHIGGDVMCSAMAALNFGIPQKFLQAIGVYGHVFANAGNVAPLSGFAVRSREALEGSMRQFLSTFRWTVGAGLVFPSRLGRLEINYCHVMAAQPTDRVKQGVQVGFSTIDL